VGDFIIRLDRLDDLHAAQLRLLVESYGLLLHDTGLAHKRGRNLQANTGRPDSVNVMDVGFSDHHHCLHVSARQVVIGHVPFKGKAEKSHPS
jgi:hypothetical protein